MGNKEFMIQAVQINTHYLSAGDATIRDDEDIVKIAVEKSGRWALQYASPRLQDNAKIVMLALQHDGSALQFASPRLRNDYKTVLTAVKKDGFALSHASEPLKRNLELNVMKEIHGLP